MIFKSRTILTVGLLALIFIFFGNIQITQAGLRGMANPGRNTMDVNLSDPVDPRVEANQEELDSQTGFFETIDFLGIGNAVSGFANWWVTSDDTIIGTYFNTQAINDYEEARSIRLETINYLLERANNTNLSEEERNAARDQARQLMNANAGDNRSNEERAIDENADRVQQITDDNPNISKAKGSLGDILGLAVSFFLYFIAYSLGVLMMLITKVMLMVAVFNNFINFPAVAIGWTITRDVCNNFFIILMIAMAIGTTLKLQNYQWRAMLPKILIAAVLINFSKMFTGIMIDASQVVMLTFAAPLATTAGYNIILASFGLPNATQLSNITSQIGSDASGQVTNSTGIEWMDIIAALLFAIIVTIAAIIVIIAITGILVYRIIMFWFLVILSPLWIFGKAFSKLEKITSQWEGEITQYLIVGPVMMFFLYLSFMTMATLGASSTGKNFLGVSDRGAGTDVVQTGNLELTSKQGNEDKSVSLSNMASPNGLINVLVIVGLLWGSLMMGQKFGGAGKGIAGSAQGWMKKYTGFNAAKSAATKAPGAVGTYVDDKLGLRSKLYSGAYQAGGKYIPGLSTFMGQKIGSLEAGTAKREQAKVDAAAAAMGMNRMNEKQLRSTANSFRASTAQRMAAAQTMMKNGWIKDDDDANRANNLRLMDFYRGQLSPELRNTFDNNFKKSNPNLAFQSSIYNGGKDIAKLTQDINDGKVKMTDLMKNADKNTMDALLKGNGGTNNGLMQWIMKNTKDDKEFGAVMAGLSDEAKDRFSKDKTSGGIDSSIFRSADADEQKKLNKMREAYIKSAKDFDFNKIFDSSDTDDLERRNNFVSANQSFVAAEAKVKQLDKIMEDVGHIFDPRAIEQIQNRGSEFENKLKNVFKGIAENLHEADLDGRSGDEAKKKAKKMMENALVSGAEVDFEKNKLGVASTARRDVLSEILTGKNKGKVLDNLAEANIGADFLRSAVKAGLSDTDYGKLNKQKVKDGFNALSKNVGTSVTDPGEQAKIFEQALMTGAKVEMGTSAQEAAMRAALNGSRRSEILRKISHENIDNNFVQNHLGDLSAREISGLSRLSVKHGQQLNTQLNSHYSSLVTGGIRPGDERKVQNVMSQMSSAGVYVDTSTPDRQSAFATAARGFNGDTLKNINLDDGGGVLDSGQILSLANNSSAKNLINFIQNPGKNQPLSEQVKLVVEGWSKMPPASLSPDQTQKVKDFKRARLI